MADTRRLDIPPGIWTLAVEGGKTGYLSNEGNEIVMYREAAEEPRTDREDLFGHRLTNSPDANYINFNLTAGQNIYAFTQRNSSYLAITEDS